MKQFKNVFYKFLTKLPKTLLKKKGKRDKLKYEEIIAFPNNMS